MARLKSTRIWLIASCQISSFTSLPSFIAVICINSLRSTIAESIAHSTEIQFISSRYFEYRRWIPVKIRKCIFLICVLSSKCFRKVQLQYMYYLRYLCVCFECGCGFIIVKLDETYKKRPIFCVNIPNKFHTMGTQNLSFQAIVNFFCISSFHRMRLLEFWLP